MDGAATAAASAPGEGRPQAEAAPAAAPAAAQPPGLQPEKTRFDGSTKPRQAAEDGADLERPASRAAGQDPTTRRGRSRSSSRDGSDRARARHRSRSGSRSCSRGRGRAGHEARSPTRSRSRERRRRSSGSRSSSRSGGSDGDGATRHRHKRHNHHRHQKPRHGEHSHKPSSRRHRHHHHHHHHRKRSRSRSPGGQRGELAADAAQPPSGGPFAAAAAAPPADAPAADGGAGAETSDKGEELMRRYSSGGASSLVRLSLRPGGAPSPAAAAAAVTLAGAPRGGGGARPRAAAPSPLGPPSLPPLHTPSAAALAAAQGMDLSDAALVQPSPMAAEATVAALSALMAQPARQPSAQAPPLPAGHAPPPSQQQQQQQARRGGSNQKQLLSFGDELDDDEAQGGSAANRPGGLSAATAKRFKHEKTLVMLNPSLSADLQAHPLSSFDDDESLPCSPMAALDRRLGQVLWGSAQAKGLRPYMEDRHTVIGSYHPRTSSGQQVQDGVFRSYAAVFDGHNGAGAAEHAADRLHHVLAAEAALRTCTGEGPPAAVLQEEERLGAALVHCFEAVDREVLARCRLEGTKGGATGLVVLRIGNQLYAAHCGDTRAVLSRGGEALRLTEDHKPNLPRERKRVEAIGGRVDFARCWRVIVDPGGGRPASGLAVSRSFGDPDFKEPLHLVTATPDVMRERLQPGDEFVILASDGLWDVLSDSEACAVVRRHLQQSGAPRQITPPQLLPGAAAYGASSFAEQLRRPHAPTAALATAAAERLVQEALDRGTMDNVTAVVGLMQWD